MDDQVLRQINENEHEFINILLLGETGTGKSTFINSFCNYLQFSSLNDAIDVPELTCLIPAKFSITTEDGDTQEVHFKKDDNENNQLGSSSTLRTKSYVFPFETKLIRIIDTPGINDTQGAIIKDRDNFLNILDYIGQLSNLHAICFLMKPDVTSITAAFKYCLVELLSRLNRSAANNIIFLFTRTRSTDYRAPETINCLKKVLGEIAKKEGVTIPLRYKSAEHRNCFFFENEGFKYLIAKQQGLQMLNPRQHKESWEVSYNSTRDLINYIVGDEKHPQLPPHDVQQTVSVNRARLLILELAKPLADLSDLTEDNVRAIQKHIENIARENMTAEELKQILYIPCVGLDVENLEKPVTVCAAGQCTETYVVGDIKKYHYKQRCHNPCFLRGVAADIIGDAKLLRCAAMIGNNCKKCGCHYSLHMHVYYETTTIQTRIKNETVVSRIATQEEMIKVQYDQIRLLEKRKAEYINEHKEITTALATFSFFLCNNSICVINDAYEEYLNVLIQNAKRRDSLESSLADRYESLKREYIEEKRQITEAAKLAKKQNITHVTSEQILETYSRLINLPLSGETINILHKIFKQGSHNEQMTNTEYVHSKIFKTPVSPAQKVKPTKPKSKSPETAMQIYKCTDKRSVIKNARNEGPDTENTTLLPIEYASGTKSYKENQLVPMGAIRKELCQIAYTGGETTSENTENARSEMSYSDMQQYIAERRVQVPQRQRTNLNANVVKYEPPKPESTGGWIGKVSRLIPGSSTSKTEKSKTKNNL